MLLSLALIFYGPCAGEEFSETASAAAAGMLFRRILLRALRPEILLLTAPFLEFPLI